MRSFALAQIMIAEALRACNRCVGLLDEVRHGLRADTPTSLVRELLVHNNVRGLAQALERISACGDLAAPINTYAEIAAREQRLGAVASALGATQTCLETARQLIGELPDNVLTGADGQLLASVRGHLLASDEARVRALERRFERTELGAAGVVIGQVQGCVAVLHNEASAWRIVDNSALANRLLLDRGVLDTYAQARKRARALLRSHTQVDGAILPPKGLAELLRWHRSLMIQLGLLTDAGLWGSMGRMGRDGGSEAQQRWQQLEAQGAQLDALLMATSHLLALWKVLGGATGGKRRKRAQTQWPHLVESLTELLRHQSALCLTAMPGVYGTSKANFRTLLGSDSA